MDYRLITFTIDDNINNVEKNSLSIVCTRS